jgi:hypothetical protein
MSPEKYKQTKIKRQEKTNKYFIFSYFKNMKKHNIFIQLYNRYLIYTTYKSIQQEN